MRAFFCLLALWAGVAQAQLTVPPLTPQGKSILAVCERVAGEGEKIAYKWRTDAGTTAERRGENKAWIWGTPGEHVLSVTVAVVKGDSLELEDYDAPFAVEGGEPGPNPPPVVKTLAQLAGKDAPTLAKMYAEFLTAFHLFDDVAHFQRTEAAAIVGRNLKGHGAADAIAKRLKVATLDELKLAVEAVVKDLGAPPPGPGPTPGPAPIPAAGLHVLIVEETDDRGRIPPGQLSALGSTQVKAYVQSKGGEFRQYDDDPDIDEPLWSAARDRPRTALPWIIVSNGDKGGIEQPLPASIDETLALIKRFE